MVATKVRKGYFDTINMGTFWKEQNPYPPLISTKPGGLSHGALFASEYGAEGEV